MTRSGDGMASAVLHFERRPAVSASMVTRCWLSLAAATTFATLLSIGSTNTCRCPTRHYGSNARVKREIHAELASSFDIRAAIDDDPLIAEMWVGLGISTTLVPEVEC